MKLLITGGAGFIGTNSADHFLRQGDEVTVFDNLSRPGTRHNLDWLRRSHGSRLRFVEGDVRDHAAVSAAVPGNDVILHLAGQVAVTTSVREPRQDFEINALGTFNVLEALRQLAPEAILINASTNKVYGGMEGLRIVEEATRYRFGDYPRGIPEGFPLDFHSPYGCSKGAADQYVLDYARIYGLRTVSLRQSCIYGPHQFGIEDQGWVAFFVIAAVLDRPLFIYGDGKQVRDILHVDDLIRSYERVIAAIDSVRGEAFNIGGGPENTLAIWAEFGPILRELRGRDMDPTYADWRPGDQRVFVADIGKAADRLGWRPQIGARTGIEALYSWVTDNRPLFRS